MEKVFKKDFTIYQRINLSNLNSLEVSVYFNFLKNEETSVFELMQLGSFAYCSREMRKVNGITQKELSKELNISENTIYNYENGKTEPSKKTKQIVKENLHISNYFLDFFSGVEKKLLKEIEEKKEEIKKDSKFTIVLKEKIEKHKEDEVLKEILKVILKEKKLRFEEINNIVNSFIMLSHNPSVNIMLEDNYLEIFYGLDAEINRSDLEKMEFYSERLSENIFNYPITIHDFIYKILIPISQYTNNIFINNNTTKSNIGIKKEVQNELNKQYIKLENILSDYLKETKDGGSDE